MCWISHELKELKSDGNVKVFKICKIINKKLCGFYYRDFQYELNTEYKQDIKMNTLNGLYFFGHDGFHSYSKDICHPLKYTPYYVRVYGKDNREIDSYFVDKDEAIVEGYLPKGTKYYINKNGVIISNKIILTKVMKNLPKGTKYYISKNGVIISNKIILTKVMKKYNNK